MEHYPPIYLLKAYALDLIWLYTCFSSSITTLAQIKNGSKIGMKHLKYTTGINMLMNVLIHIHYQISNYSSLIDDLQRDSDDDETREKTDTLEIPFQEDSHFKKFAIKYRTRESVEDVKLVLAKLEKESLLLNLIPIAYDDELEKDVQFNELFVNTKDSINIIWDFILISSRFYGEPEGLFECYADEFKRLDKYFLEHSTLPLAESEVIVDIFKYYININDNLLGQRNIEIGTDAIDTLCGDTDVLMEETLVTDCIVRVHPPGITSTKG